ncbi:CHASE3 domain-containing protein [Streptomyces sp. J2-1]|uniref:sensor histidine kinase n=1 Tax=Streptomyces corallincola TaxID=2851888 RepID=UPI001C3955ED|nr:sensor histidine kinase [Streptomyces corallincola]MBV2356324.1 CHASE3 domain-containing protein [Streptomyces corallincola]
MNSKPSDSEGVFADWTTRRWLQAGVATTLVVLAVLGSLGGWATWRTTGITDELVYRRSPALIDAMRLEEALVNQETGIRGYGLSGRADFLQPYRDGVTDERTAIRGLRPLVRQDDRARTDLADVERLATAWQRAFADPVAAASPGDTVRVAAQRAEAGKTSFDAVRQALARQQDHLRSESADAIRDRRAATTVRNWTFAVVALVIVLVAALVFEGLRRGVTGPLARLGTAARDVARGRFEQPLPGTGPADLRRLAADVDSMRLRLLAELQSAEDSRRMLDEQADDLKRSNTELEQFAYVASHDLQEPLRKVSSFTQLLQRRYGGQLDERADQYIAFAVDGANRMQTLINDLLAFSRVGRVHNDHQSVDMDAVFTRALENVSVAVEETGAEITHDTLPPVVGDATQLGMLWQNLLSNALKFRAPGRPPHIHVGLTATEDGAWEFAVSDNGIGIAPEFQEKVFVIFQRLHTKDAYPGTGIGLAMCKKVVEFHGGHIGIDPGYRLGTRVLFTLPAVPALPAQETPGSRDARDSADVHASQDAHAGRRAALADSAEGGRP